MHKPVQHFIPININEYVFSLKEVYKGCNYLKQRFLFKLELCLFSKLVMPNMMLVCY